MKKREFLVSVAIAAAAVSAAPIASGVENHPTDGIRADQGANGEPKSKLTIGNELFVLTRPSASTVLAQHESHASHDSHDSHDSHSSHSSHSSGAMSA
jgi:hypothetical protein